MTVRYQRWWGCLLRTTPTANIIISSSNKLPYSSSPWKCPGVITTVRARSRDKNESEDYYIAIVPWFNIKMAYYQYRKSHCGDKTVVRSSYLPNGISYTGKMTSLYWIRAQDVHPTTATAGLFGIFEEGLTLSITSDSSQKEFSDTLFICEYKYHSWNITDLPVSLNWKIRLLGLAHLFLDRWVYGWICRQLLCSKLKCVFYHPTPSSTMRRFLPTRKLQYLLYILHKYVVLLVQFTTLNGKL